MTDQITYNLNFCFQESVNDEVSGSREEKAEISVFSKYKWSHGKTTGKRGKSFQTTRNCTSASVALGARERESWRESIREIKLERLSSYLSTSKTDCLI